MTTDSEKSRYLGAKGWESDPELFARVAVTWKQWIGHSGDHLYAAQLLLPHIQQWEAEIQRLIESKHRGTVKLAPSLKGIYFFHCAFCVENAFKGVIAARSAAAFEGEMRKTKRLPKLMRGHDLVELAAKAVFPLKTDEEYALAFLSRYGTWAGRYPLPLHNDAYGLTEKLSNGGHYLVGAYRPDQVPTFVDFCANLYTWARGEAAQTDNEQDRPAERAENP
jgi:hypothetical protein